MIIAADVDDTICPSTKVVQKVLVHELLRLQKGGVKLVFLSGSTVPQIQAQLGQNLSVEHWLLGATGTHAVHYTSEKTQELYRLQLALSLRKKVVAAFERLVLKNHLQTQSDEDDQIQDRGSQVTLTAIGRAAPEEAKRLFDPNGSRRRVWAEQLRIELGSEVDVHVGGTTSIDVTAPGVDKAWGLKKFLAHTGFGSETLVYFGDQLNKDGNDYPLRSLVPCVRVKSPDQTLEYLKSFTDFTAPPDLPYMASLSDSA